MFEPGELEPAPGDRGRGVARGLAAAERARPEDCIERPLEKAKRQPRRANMLPEPQFAGWLEHAPDLGECRGGVGDGAEHSHRDDGGEASVLGRQCLGRALDDVDRDVGGLSALDCYGPRVWVGFDRDKLGHTRRVVLERAPVAAADLEHPPA